MVAEHNGSGANTQPIEGVPIRLPSHGKQCGVPQQSLAWDLLLPHLPLLWLLPWPWQGPAALEGKGYQLEVRQQASQHLAQVPPNSTAQEAQTKPRIAPADGATWASAVPVIVVRSFSLADIPVLAQNLIDAGS